MLFSPVTATGLTNISPGSNISVGTTWMSLFQFSDIKERVLFSEQKHKFFNVGRFWETLGPWWYVVFLGPLVVVNFLGPWWLVVGQWVVVWGREISSNIKYVEVENILVSDIWKDQKIKSTFWTRIKSKQTARFPHAPIIPLPRQE